MSGNTNDSNAKYAKVNNVSSKLAGVTPHGANTKVNGGGTGSAPVLPKATMIGGVKKK